MYKCATINGDGKKICTGGNKKAAPVQGGSGYP